jgi:hypothetical protein
MNSRLGVAKTIFAVSPTAIHEIFELAGTFPFKYCGLTDAFPWLGVTGYYFYWNFNG